MSVKELNKPPQSYQPEDYPVTSYDKAKAEWDNRLGSARVQAYNWRLAFFSAMVVIFLLTGGLIYQNSRITIVPYIVMSGPDGSVVSMGKVGETRPANDKEKQAFITQFIKNTRSLTLDPIVNKGNWTVAYKLMTSSAAAKMDGITKQEKTFERFGQETVTVNVKVVMPMSKDTYQARWTETVFTNDGRIKSSYEMSGLFTIDQGNLSQEKDLRINPLSIFIKDFSWSKES